MSVLALLTPSNGALTLSQGAKELAAFQPLFEFFVGSTTLAMSGVSGPALDIDGVATIEGATSAWGGAGSRAQIRFNPDATAGRIAAIRLSRPIDIPDWTKQLPFGLANVRETVEAVAASDDPGDLRFERSVEADASIGPASVRFRGTHEGGNRIRIELASDPKAGPKLEDLVHLIGRDAHPDSDLRWLPESLRNAALVGLETAAIVFDFDISKRPIQADVRLRFLGETTRPVIPGLDFPRIGKLWADLDIDYPLDPDLRFAELSLGGSLLVDSDSHNSIDITARWPDLRVSGALAPNGKILLGSMLGKLGLPSSALPDDGPKINGLSFSAAPLGKRKTFAFAAEFVSLWAFPIGAGKTLSLEDLQLNAFWSSDGGMNASLQAAFMISGRRLFLLADEAGGSWTFEGRLDIDPAQPLTVGDWIEDLVKWLGADVHVPQRLRDSALTQLGLQFHTASREMTFALGCRVPIGDSLEVDASLTFHCASDAVQGWQINVAGALKIGAYSFALTFDKTDSSRLIAVLGSDTPRPASVGALVAALGGPKGLDIPIDLKTVLAAVTGDKDKPLRIFAVDIGAGIDLASLPLVGPLLHADSGLSIDFQLSFASRDLAESDAGTVQAINKLLPARATPLPDAKEIKKGPGVEIAIAAGSEKPKIIGLPIKADPQSSTGGLVHDAAAPPPATSDDGVKWIDLDKHFGPAHFKRVGIAYANSEVKLVLDAELSVGPLTFSLMGLSVRSAISPISPKFDLAGMGLSYSAGQVQISGAFLRESHAGTEEYIGAALIKTEALTLSALGVYADTGGRKSLIVYAVLDRQIGGPAFFFVTGLAVGFGYNRALLMPPLDKVKDFPLVVRATKPPAAIPDLRAEAAAIRDALPVSFDEHFLAVGIKFNSFKMIDSFALLAVQFGRSVEVDLLGVSTLVLPTPPPGVPTQPAPGLPKPPALAVVQVELKAVFLPDEGTLKVEALLTNASYVLSPDCRLTGGFAFYAWFKGPSAGEFVVTLGGYHPSFDPPPEYPRPPRVGLNWPVDPHIQLKGDLYCALTPVAMMAGGHVEATYRDGAIQAWFKAGVDFLCAWKPYHYDLTIYVDLGGSYTFHFLGTHTITIDVGAELHVWGPEFSGTAHVSIYCVSFDVGFGAGASALPKAISWDDFEATLLPGRDAVASIAVVDGLLEMREGIAVVAPSHFRMTTASAIPAKTVGRGSVETDAALEPVFADGVTITPTTVFGVAPVGVAPADFKSAHSVSVWTIAGGARGKDITQKFSFGAVAKQAPAGLWGSHLVPDTSHIANRFVGWAVSGFDVRPLPPTKPAESHAGPYAALAAGDDVQPARIAIPKILDARLGVVDETTRRTRIAAAMSSRAAADRRAALRKSAGLESEPELLPLGLEDDFLIAPQILEEARAA